MKGRYGFDKLFFAVAGLCAFIALLSYTVLWRIPHLDIRGVLSVTGLIMIINTSRVFSKQLGKRQAENIRFTLWLNKTFRKKKHPKRRNVSAAKGNVPNRVSAKAKCSCGQALKIPSESGRHIVLCPKCGSRNLIDV